MMNYKILISFIIIVLIIVPLSGCKSFYYGFENQTAVGETIEEENNKSSIDIKEIEKDVDSLIERIKSVENHTEIEEVLSMFENNSNLEVNYIYLAMEVGGFSVYPFVEMPQDYDARTRRWYIEATEEEKYISEIFLDAVTGEESITIAKKIEIDGNLFGVVGIDIAIGK